MVNLLRHRHRDGELVQLFVVAGPCHSPEDSHGLGEVGIIHAAQHIGQCRLLSSLVVYKEIARRVPSVEIYYLRLTVSEDNAFVIVFSEDKRLAVLQNQAMIVANTLVSGIREGAVVEDSAILVDLNEGCALMQGGAVQHHAQVCVVDVDAAGCERCFGPNGYRQRSQRVVYHSVRGCLRLLSLFRCRGILPLGKPVNAVVKQQNVYVNVASDGMEQVVSTDTEAISISGDDPDGEVRSSEFDAGGNGQSSAMDAMKAVGVEIVGEAAGTPDAGDKDDVSSGNVEIGKDFFDLGEYSVIPTSGAPAYLLVGSERAGFKVAVDGIRGHFHSPCIAFLMPASISATRKGRPSTLLIPWASTRNSPLILSSNCPVLSSGIRTVL